MTSPVPKPPCYRIVLAKEDFKFSAAHFTLFPDGGAELLHGHNYRVRVELSGGGLNAEGLLVDLESFKKRLRGQCARLDNMTLLPSESQRLRWSHVEGALEVRCGKRLYCFPVGDVLLLPLVNTSIELLAKMLWEELAPHVAGSRVESMGVSVEESAGQSCWYEAGVG